MRQPIAVAVVAAALFACGDDALAPPSSRATDGRFLAFHPDRFGPCDRIEVPARGVVPAVEGEGTWLVEVPGSALDPFYDSTEIVPVLRLPEAGFVDGVDVVDVPAPHRAWRVEGGAYVEVDLVRTTLPRLGVQLASACAVRLAERCRSGDVADAECSTFAESVDVYIPDAIDRGLGAIAPLGGERALALRKPRRLVPRAAFFDLDATTSRATEIPGVAVDDVAHLAAYQRRPGEELWLFGPAGALARGTLDAGFTVVRGPELPSFGPTPAAEHAWIDGPHDGSAFELFALDSLGTFAHYDGQALVTLDAGDGTTFDHGDVLWLRPGEAIAVGSHASAVLRFVDGAVRTEPLGQREDRPTAAALVPSLGVVVGTARGLLYVDAGAGWTRLPSPDDDLAVHGITPHAGGFVFGRSQENGTGGRVVEYSPAVGLCPSARVTIQNVQRLYPIEGGFLTYAKDEPTHALVGFVRLMSRYPSCD